MKKHSKIFMGFIVFLLIFVQTASSGTKLVSVIKGGSEAAPAVLAESVIIKRNGLDISPKIRMKLNVGDEIITKQDTNAVLEGGCYRTTISEKTCLIVKEDTFEYKWGNILNQTKTDSSCRPPIEIKGGKQLLPEGTLFYIEEKSDGKANIDSSDDTTPNIIVLEGEVKLTFNNGKQQSETLPAYTGYINGKVLGKGITTGSDFNASTASNYGGGGSMLGRKISVPQLSSYSGYSDDPVEEKIAKIKNWFGDVILASNYDFGETGIKYAKKAKRSDIGSIASAKDYGTPVERSASWAGDSTEGHRFKPQRDVITRPSPSYSASPSSGKIIIASIIIGEAKSQTVIIKSKNGHTKSAFKNMQLKDGDQIMTRDASVILEADNGKLFYLLSNQTHVQLKQGKIDIISGNAYYSDSIYTKANEWVSMVKDLSVK